MTSRALGALSIASLMTAAPLLAALGSQAPLAWAALALGALPAAQLLSALSSSGPPPESR